MLPQTSSDPASSLSEIHEIITTPSKKQKQKKPLHTRIGELFGKGKISRVGGAIENNGGKYETITLKVICPS